MIRRALSYACVGEGRNAVKARRLPGLPYVPRSLVHKCNQHPFVTSLISYEIVFNSKLFGNEIYCTDRSCTAALNSSCTEFHWLNRF